jgi:hypothetical protein
VKGTEKDGKRSTLYYISTRFSLLCPYPAAVWVPFHPVLPLARLPGTSFQPARQMEGVMVDALDAQGESF